MHSRPPGYSIGALCIAGSGIAFVGLFPTAFADEGSVWSSLAVPWAVIASLVLLFVLGCAALAKPRSNVVLALIVGAACGAIVTATQLVVWGVLHFTDVRPGLNLSCAGALLASLAAWRAARALAPEREHALHPFAPVAVLCVAAAAVSAPELVYVHQHWFLHGPAGEIAAHAALIVTGIAVCVYAGYFRRLGACMVSAFALEFAIATWQITRMVTETFSTSWGGSPSTYSQQVRWSTEPTGSIKLYVLAIVVLVVYALMLARGPRSRSESLLPVPASEEPSPV
jgi:hypothetical protein